MLIFIEFEGLPFYFAVEKSRMIRIAMFLQHCVIDFILICGTLSEACIESCQLNNKPLETDYENFKSTGIAWTECLEQLQEKTDPDAP